METVEDTELDKHKVNVGVGVAVDVADKHNDKVGEGEFDSDVEPQTVGEGLKVYNEGVMDAEEHFDDDTRREEDGRIVELTDNEFNAREGDIETLPDDVGDTDRVEEIELLHVVVGDTDEEGVAEKVKEMVGEVDKVSVPEFVTVFECVGDKLAPVVDDKEPVGLEQKVANCVPVAHSVGLMEGEEDPHREFRAEPDAQ